MFDKIAVALFAAFLIAVGVAIITPPTPEQAAAATEARAALPAGATLLYENDHNSRPKRLLRVENCYFVEEWNGDGWGLLNADGTAAFTCVP